ncbi:hypothetical protein KY290_010394 [Solanum tuberosum]|uniref:Uncharacterized protein n=1 Tax=Solanum tuberosum TaxID=4113 RepID=A0ABQ7VXP8_SOLTU|nr:hypothetical protein KY284_010311 [Solanum tuberosum]KAH0773257.1 hypothetical protein KY290_010394 [Solanum tuberosum]
MRDLLIQHHLHKALGRLIQKAQIHELEDWEEMDEKAASAIRLHLTDDVLANLGVKIEEEDKFIVLLNSLPSSYDNLATTILHGNDSIELKDVTSTLLLNEKMRKSLKITDKLSSQKVETEVTKGVQATMVDSKLVESLRSDQNQRPEIATIVINQVNSKEIVRI